MPKRRGKPQITQNSQRTEASALFPKDKVFRGQGTKPGRATACLFIHWH
jgi:hypothetical protein